MNTAAPRWCVLIPCLNEEAAIRAVVESVLALGAPVIVVDDGSDDRTPEIVAALPVTLLRHATRRGKGEALRQGFREALRQGYDAVLTMDGDGQHLAADIPRIVAAAQRHPQHIVIGARLLDREQQPKGRRRANAVADWGISWACAQPVADTQSGQRWYPQAALALVDLPAENFVFEAAILIAASREQRLGVVSVPIASRYHGAFRPSHLKPVRDVTRITTYTIGRVVHYGHIVASYRRSRGAPLVLDDTAAAPAKPMALDG
ncbi:dolichyl-phosphate mannose synthase [Rhodanobacter thiooxydans]|uniref:Dolichyl-phosphate mannose synthase n=1 Tax=Rhodanobacter thiooxydans TaxID=416169 RepID=A0A154QGE7_9GAMM|nr:glycosyltransferase family 2 protein [Rhodanobacter thiooxydans]EIL98289.1 glycosyl transferase family protein [Rhodanobacter thiooxydans LCS2]KZC23037.1 dolichyl-phosphate mannose synthase [Rhodanobacter thiooxydans]MCW0203011.1 glycosyltransferase family 2 protein [Rhodanobacter thiooxydans]